MLHYKKKLEFKGYSEEYTLQEKKTDESAGVSYCLMQSSDYLCDIHLFDFHAFWLFLTFKGDKIPQRTGSITNHTGYFESKSCTVFCLFYALSLILSLLSYIIIANSHNINNNFV